MPRSTLALAAVLALSLLLAGCLSSSPKNSVACGNDISCFKTQVQQSCGPATATFSRNGVTIDSEVTSLASGQCNIRIQLKDIIAPEDASEQSKAEIDKARPLFPLANMDCKVEKTDAPLLDDPAFLTQPATLEKCEGVLKDQIQQRLSLFTSGAPTPSPSPSASPSPSLSPGPSASPGSSPSPSPSSSPSVSPSSSSPSPSASPSPSPSPSSSTSPSPSASPSPSPSPADASGCNLAHAQSTLSGGSCVIVSCNAPWLDCDRIPSNGCEVNPLNSPTNCGACGVVCPQGNACIEGKCIPQ